MRRLMGLIRWGFFETLYDSSDARDLSRCSTKLYVSLWGDGWSFVASNCIKVNAYLAFL